MDWRKGWIGWGRAGEQSGIKSKVFVVIYIKYIIYLCLNKADQLSLAAICPSALLLHPPPLHPCGCLLCTHTCHSVSDSVRWIAGMWGDWQVTGPGLIRRQSMMEVTTLTFSSYYSRQVSSFLDREFDALPQAKWGRATGVLVEHLPIAQQITFSL